VHNVVNKDNIRGLEKRVSDLKYLHSTAGKFVLSSSYTPTADNTKVTFTIPVIKGHIVKVSAPESLTVSGFQGFDSIELGTNRVYYGDLSSKGCILCQSNYLTVVVQKADSSIFNEQEVSDIILGVTFEDLGISPYFIKEDYYHNHYGSFTSVDINNTELFLATIANNNGQEFINRDQSITNYIPVKPLSRLSVEVLDNSFEWKAFFYHITENGTVTWESQYKWSDYSRVGFSGLGDIDVVVPPTANAVRFCFVATPANVSSSKIAISMHTSPNVCQIEPYDSIIPNRAIRLGNSEWAQGRNNGNKSDSQKPYDCILCKVFKVIPGQRLIFKRSNRNVVYSFRVLAYENIENSNTQTSYVESNFLNATYIVPTGINYIRVIAYGGYRTTLLTPAMCIEDDWHIIECSGNPFMMQHSEKLWDWNRATSYAQGMAIQNDYVFQAFADGYVDIWNLKTKELIDSVFVPLATGATVEYNHCNNLTFGVKYDNSDEFGVLWINNAGIDTPMLGIRISRDGNKFTFTKVYEVTPPHIDTSLYKGDGQYIDFYNKQLVQFTFVIQEGGVVPPDGYGDAMFFVYTFDTFETGEFTLIHSFRLPIMWAPQAGRLIDGILYFLSGTENTTTDLSDNHGAVVINIINVYSKEYIGCIDLRRQCFGIMQEPQGIDWNGVPYVSSTKGLYKLYL
jgi:hypothetical protein